MHVLNLLIIAATDCDLAILTAENYKKCCKCFPSGIRKKLAQNYRKIIRGEKFPNSRKVCENISSLPNITFDNYMTFHLELLLHLQVRNSFNYLLLNTHSNLCFVIIKMAR